MAARDFLGQIRRRRGRKGGEGYAGPDLSRVALPAFWATLLLSQRRKRLAMTLIGEEHKDAAAVRPYLREKQAAREILDAIPGIDAESLVGFVDVAIGQFQPPGASGRPLVPTDGSDSDPSGCAAPRRDSGRVASRRRACGLAGRPPRQESRPRPPVGGGAGTRRGSLRRLAQAPRPAAAARLPLASAAAGSRAGELQATAGTRPRPARYPHAAPAAPDRLRPR